MDFAASARPRLWDVFCRVVDNHGDIGVCWRLASQLAQRGQLVRLWVDDPSALHWMAPGALEGTADESDNLSVLRWSGEASPGPANAQADLTEPGDVVVEAFGCNPPDGFVARMAARPASGGAAPVWINLEYLSAEPYVERSHGLPSPVSSGPGAGLVKTFFFPGFTPRTGGVLQGFAAGAEAPRPRASGAARQISLFCYQSAPVADFMRTLAAAVPTTGPLHLQVCTGQPAAAVGEALGFDAFPGTLVEQDGVTTEFLPPLTQLAYDQLLARCDLNLVRGEDSWVRAQLAGKPFVWQPYVQADGAHLHKLDAFLALSGLAGTPCGQAMQGWSRGQAPSPSGLAALLAPEAAAACGKWQRALAGQPDLATRLLAQVARQATPSLPGHAAKGTGG
jgi:uncharacterized repeat protein (TIGR03837 family)